jgi:hypothetical protein
MGNLGETRVDFLKIDVEGFEYWVLRGAENVLRSNPEVLIFFECNAGAERTGHTQQEVYDFLQRVGLRVFAHDQVKQEWSDDRNILLATGQLWACRHEGLLPDLH